ncbi:pyridoxal phosphate-dependent aminotransferase [Nocardioides lianchengensis]|uniref:N-succinyldiaminopimelate aminotransferase n=1 Tax=Nocardioides lianchengensis TaxID=1045774 RepID=A0A1G6Y2T2_9ACTN|nr:pyridoxal phosphate-dependent aminotransferase [Nocardioides lianchengensis]NYG13512.1 N-succinyldiaminopimelate aminotransferase [Nocardioides lianchengensis]SDD83925.1 N-succinyldiaminopimelate aminotransferase [Nocardioides lianchengensis]
MPQQRLAQRLHGIAPTIFSEMSALAMRTGSVNLGQGFPDVDGPPAVIAEAVRALEGGQNQYAPGLGVPALRQAVARHQHRHYGIELDPDIEVVVTTGATEGIAAALLGLVDPGDEIIVLEPYYDSYVAMIQMAGGVRRPVTLRAPDFRLDPDELRAAVTDRTQFVLLNSPHNPTGTVLTRAELQAVADLAVERDLVVITDEVYEHLTYDAEHVPISTLPGMAERTLTLSSAGKSYSFTGWKVGWASGPRELVQAVLAAKQWLTFTSGSPLQPAVAHALDEAPGFPRQLAAALRERRDRLCAGLTEVGLDVRVPQGTYFATTDISALGWADGLAFCLALPERAGVVAIPHQVFHDGPAGDQLVRWAFCKEPDVVEEGLRRLAAADLRA